MNFVLATMDTATGPLRNAFNMVVSFLARYAYLDTLPAVGVIPLVN